jgi:hypothetical protein
MVSTVHHREAGHPPFGLRLRHKAFSCRLWDAIQAAIGSEDRRSVDDRKSHSFHHEQRGMPAERVAQLEKAAALSPELKTGANSNHTLSMTDGAAGERVGE